MKCATARPGLEPILVVTNRLGFMKEQRTATEVPAGVPRRAGFTLIELLTVISIMALLAGIGAGAGGVASRKMREARSRTANANLVTAIESYRNDFNQYPPDHIDPDKNVAINPAINPLFYELIGTISTNQGANYHTVDQTELIASTTIRKVYGREGLLNSVDLSVDRSRRPKHYLPSLKKDDWGEIGHKPDIEALLVPVKWPNAWRNVTAVNDERRPPLQGFATDQYTMQLNPWYYVSTGPTNNPTGFDLWGRVPIGGKVRLIANWNVASEVATKK